jgi:glycosyltransferase involved in cell wall biosynthesis
MLISIVIINYNYGLYIAEAIESALLQRHDDIEVVVVDDGSTDGSLDTIRHYGGRVKLITQQNAGHIAAVNAGFAACTGEAVIFLDADDFLYPGCASEVAAAWSEGLSKIQFRLDTVNDIGVDQEMPFPHFPRGLSEEDIRRWALVYGVYPWPVSSGNAFARSYLEKLLPVRDPLIFKSPDGYLNKMAPLYGGVNTIGRELGAYRVHGKNRWAQAGASQIARVSAEWVYFDHILQDEFERRARTLGYRATPYNRLRNVQQAEYRLLSKRFAGKDAPNARESRGSLLRVGLESAFRAPNIGAVGRLVWSIWFIALAALTQRQIAHLFVKSRGQIGRSLLSRFLINLSRRGTSAATVGVGMLLNTDWPVSPIDLG